MHTSNEVTALLERVEKVLREVKDLPPFIKGPLAVKAGVLETELDDMEADLTLAREFVENDMCEKDGILLSDIIRDADPETLIGYIEEILDTDDEVLVDAASWNEVFENTARNDLVCIERSELDTISQFIDKYKVE